MRKHKTRIFRGIKKFWLISSTLLIILSGFYVFQVNTMAAESAFIEEEGKKLRKMGVENENLQLEFTRVNSLENLENKVLELNFKKVTDISYIKAIETWVAVK